MSFDYIKEPSQQQSGNYPMGEDWWNRSKESRKHPELYSSGHGTVSVPWSLDDQEYKYSSQQQTSHHTDKKLEKLLLNNEKQQQKEQDHQMVVGSFGHTLKRHKYTVRSVHRDLDNI